MKNKVLMLFFIISLVNAVLCTTPEEQAYNELVRIVNSNCRPKGKPFPSSIASPNCGDSIGIVGAGPAGIHMAYLLKKKGFKRVVILEKSGRIGGKSYTVRNRDVVHEMGTCYNHPDYKDNLISLAKELGLWRPLDIPPSTIREDYQRAPITYRQYVLEQVMKIMGTRNVTIAQRKLFASMIKYAILHRKLFGKYDGELMREPYRWTMRKIKGTFRQFLKDNDIDVLTPIFIASHTVQGYGHLDEISAIYGLMWNTPNFLKSLAEKFLGMPNHLLTMIRGGFQEIWTTLARKERLRIIFGNDIVKVERKRRSVKVYNSHGTCRTFNFLIWTPSLYSNRPFKYTWRERKIFLKLKPAWFTTTLFNSTYGVRGLTPIDYWMDNIEHKREHYVWAQRDSYGTLQEFQGESYKAGLYPGGPDGKFIRTGVLYQYGKRKPQARTLSRLANCELRKTKASSINYIERRTWEYFPKFSPKDMAKGILWDIVRLQGKRRTWFAGSSVIFESVKSVLEYNKLLVARMGKRCYGKKKTF